MPQSQSGPYCIPILQKLFPYSLDQIVSFFKTHLTNPLIFCSISLLLSLLLIGILLNRRSIKNSIHDWLIIVRDGRIVKADIGKNFFLWPHQSYIRFANKIFNIQVKTESITKQFQGIFMELLLSWKINPKKGQNYYFYHYINTGQANTFIYELCSSKLKNIICELPFEEALRNKEVVIEEMKKQLKGSFTEWGIQLTFLEISDVKILSKDVEEKLSRELTYFEEIEKEKMNENKKLAIKEAEICSKLTIFKEKLTGMTETAQQKYLKQIQILKNQEENQNSQTQIQIQCYEIKKKGDSKIRELKEQAKQEVQKIQKEREKLDVDLQKEKRKIQEGKLYNEKMLEKHRIDVKQQVFQKMKVKQIQIGQQSKEGFAGLGPIISAFDK